MATKKATPKSNTSASRKELTEALQALSHEMKIIVTMQTAGKVLASLIKRPDFKPGPVTDVEAVESAFELANMLHDKFDNA